ncbi:phosphate transporter pho1 like protein 1, partial [Quercus suber]
AYTHQTQPLTFLSEIKAQIEKNNKMVKFSKQFEGQLVPEWKEAFVDYWQLKKDLKKIHLLNTTTDNINTPTKQQTNSIPNTLFSNFRKRFSLFGHQHKDHGAIQAYTHQTQPLTFLSEIKAQIEKNNKMVKFSKQFEGQLVPEWKEAFVDYWQLKKDLKKIHLLNTTTDNINTPTKQQTNSIPNTLFSNFRKRFSLFGHQHKDHGAIQVHKKLASSASKGDMYETELLEQFADTDATKEFFACLDHQLNKVNQFFQTKEAEFMERGESLKKQMEILIEVKTAFKKQRGKGAIAQESKDDPSISCTITCEEDSVKDRTEQDQPQENSIDDTGKSDVPFIDSLSSESSDDVGNSLMQMRREDGKMRTLSGRVFNCQGKNLKINIPLTTPTRTFSALSYLVWEDLMNPSSKKCGPEGRKLQVNRTKLHHAEKMIRGAYVELYKGLGYLKTYRTLNMLAFMKILKKFDKVTGNKFFQFITKRLSDPISTAQTRKARINYSFIFELSPTRELKYRDVFLICTTSMTAVIGVMFVHLSLLTKGYTFAEVQAIPGLLVLIFLLVLVCPFNIIYRSSRYRFLRGLNLILRLAWLQTVLHYKFQQVDDGVTALFLAALEVIRRGCGIFSGNMTFWDSLENEHLNNAGHFRAVKTVPLPFHEVVMLDFFMADQLCSQIPMLRNLESVACYYITRSYETEDYGYCNKHYRDLAYAVSFLPYYWRAMQ